MEGGWGRERGEGKAQGIEKVEGTDDRTLRSTNGVIYPLRSTPLSHLASPYELKIGGVGGGVPYQELLKDYCID